MLTRPSEPIEGALSRLPPVDRALLELSLRPGVSDDEIAGVLNVGVREVQNRRAAALKSLADHMGGPSGENLAAIVEPKPGDGKRVTNGARSDAATAQGTVPAARPTGAAASAEPVDQGAARAGAATIEVKPSPRFELPRVHTSGVELPSRPRLLALAGAALACLVLIVVLLAGGGDEPKAPGAKGGRPAKPAAGLKAAMLPVGGETRATGSVQLRGSTLSVRAEDLPRASNPYTVWVYDSVTKAVPVGSLRGPNDSLEARLPKGFEGYDFIDVSREPADGNPNHSGASVVRAPLKPLLAGG